jgi:hypothetical protein
MRRHRWLLLSSLLATTAFLLTGVAAASPLPGAPSCAIFPSDNWWNVKVDTLPAAANSQTIINTIGPTLGLHADFGSGTWQGKTIGIPITVVPDSTPKSTVTFQYASESDPGPYPIPSNVAIEGGSDHHALIVDRDTCTLYELWHLAKKGSHWTAGSGAIWNLESDALRPLGWTSADAAGLPIVPGLARYSEVASGLIDHALRFTVPQTQRAYVYPARHYASTITDASYPPMGMRLRLKASFDISKFPPQSRVILQALKTYGMMVADNGSSWFVSGEPNANWNNTDLHSFGQVPGSAFEVVDMTSVYRPSP